MDWMELPLCGSGTRPQPQLKGLSDSQEVGCECKPATLLHEQTTTPGRNTYTVKMAVFMADGCNVIAVMNLVMSPPHVPYMALSWVALKTFKKVGVFPLPAYWHKYGHFLPPLKIESK